MRLALAFVLLLTSTAASRAAEVIFVVSDVQPAYREVVDATRAELSRDQALQHGIRIFDIAMFETAPPGLPSAIVAVGTRAFQAVAASSVKAVVFATLLPRAAFDMITRERAPSETRRFSAVFLDQPFGRQLDLVRVALPGRDRVGVLLGPESERALPALQAAAAERRMPLHAQRAANEKELHPALQRLLADADVLLALPDSGIFNVNTVPHILLASYRHGIPVVGFSQAYVKAGAVVAVYSTPAQIGAQTGEMVRSFLSSGNLPAPQHPRYFTVNTNPHVARTLERAIEDPTVLQEKLHAAEGPN